jgi:mRNA-degrading endonuclease RelE of RelBE toxin-antitoxin system
MKVEYIQSFVTDYSKLEASLQKRIDQKIKLLSTNPRHPGLRVRKMVNQKRIYEARVDIHNRMTFEIQGELILMRRVGTHEIYRKP